MKTRLAWSVVNTWLEMRKKHLFFSFLGIFIIGIYAYNAALFHDDLFLVEYLPKLVQGNHLIGGLKTIFFSLDLPGEYRLYGVSRIIHLFLALAIGYGMGDLSIVTWVFNRFFSGIGRCLYLDIFSIFCYILFPSLFLSYFTFSNYSCCGACFAAAFIRIF